jgi:hypothetical protein
MNLWTRSFGYYHLPNQIALCPLIDLINHTSVQTKLQFFLNPSNIETKMLDIEI